MIVRKIEAWYIARGAFFFDESHKGKSPMPWDVVLVAVTSESKISTDHNRFFKGVLAQREVGYG